MTLINCSPKQLFLKIKNKTNLKIINKVEKEEPHNEDIINILKKEKLIESEKN